MGVHGCVSRSSGQVLTVAIRDMLTSFGVTEALGKTEVDYIYIMLFFANSDQKVVWFDISVKKVA